MTEKRKRLSPEAHDHLTMLTMHYGLTQIELFEYLLREEHVRVVAEKARTVRSVPLNKVVSPEVTDEDADEMDAQDFGRLKASITRAELDRP